MQISEKAALIAGILGIPAVISAVASSALVLFGRSILPLAQTSLWHAGIIGAVQAVVGNYVYFEMLRDQNNKDNVWIELGKYIGSHIVTAAALFAISLLAVKVGIIASSISLTGMVVLALANCALSFGSLHLTGTVFEMGQEQGWIENTAEN